MIDPETGWDDLVWRPGPLGPDQPGEPEPLDIVNAPPLTITGLLQDAAKPKPLEGTSLSLLMNDQKMADAGVDKVGSSPKSGAPDTAQDPSAQTKPGTDDIAGKIWNAPNTILGVGYGGLGYLAGWPSKWLGLQKDAPGITTGNNAIQFTDNPMGGPSAITLGNTQAFGYKPTTMGGDGNRMGPHEEQHTYQGQQLGPLYLPSNILGGVAGLLIDGSWHGPHNWNELGPQQHPPVPWPK
jgi:hypothetical protein